MVATVAAKKTLNVSFRYCRRPPVMHQKRRISVLG